MKALALFSGGLDSTLAIKLIRAQGIEVIALHCITPFARYEKEEKERLAQKLKEQLGAELKVIELGDEFLEIVKNPKFGYGKNLNPCIDCKILMLQHARQLMKAFDASFIITGEVVGQRPKSQHRDTLRLIEKGAGLEGLLLRPLSAKLLAPTVAETKGWVKRENLFDMNGRTRKPQMQLAEKLGIKDYAWPAGGCLLTVSSFCGRVKDLLEHNDLTRDNVRLLHIGRHFRVTPFFKLVVGKDEKQNARLLDLAKPADVIFEPHELPGPTGLGRGMGDDNAKVVASEIIARYSALGNEEVRIIIRSALPEKEEVVFARGIDEKKLREFMR